MTHDEYTALLASVEGHTPGPWEVGQTCTYETAIVAASGLTVAHAAWEGGSSCSLDFSNEQTARLIAAAPDLLKEVGRLRSAMEATRLKISGGLCYASAEAKHCQLRDADTLLEQTLRGVAP